MNKKKISKLYFFLILSLVSCSENKLNNEYVIITSNNKDFLHGHWSGNQAFVNKNSSDCLVLKKPQMVRDSAKSKNWRLAADEKKRLDTWKHRSFKKGYVITDSKSKNFLLGHWSGKKAFVNKNSSDCLVLKKPQMVRDSAKSKNWELLPKEQEKVDKFSSKG
jgi:hypothetical protein